MWHACLFSSQKEHGLSQIARFFKFICSQEVLMLLTLTVLDWDTYVKVNGCLGLIMINTLCQWKKRAVFQFTRQELLWGRETTTEHVIYKHCTVLKQPSSSSTASKSHTVTLTLYKSSLLAQGAVLFLMLCHSHCPSSHPISPLHKNCFV